MSTISVIIPAYNAEKYIAEAIESALNQTRSAKEIIVVDDASTDRTVEIAKGFGDRVQVLVNPVNSGPGHSRNAGVAISTGDYLAFLDADDVLKENHLDVMGGLLDRWSEAGMAIPCVLETDVAGNVLGAPWVRWECVEKPSDLFAKAMRGTALIFSGNFMVRRDQFNHIGGFSEIDMRYRGRRVQVEDNDLYLRLSTSSLFISSSIPTVFYRRHKAQASVFKGPQWVLFFKYRLRLLKQLRTRSDSRQLFNVGYDRLLRAYECEIEQAWVRRDLEILRMYLKCGALEPMFFTASYRYFLKAILPRIFCASVEVNHGA